MLVIYKHREMSYDQDWHDGFASVGWDLHEYRKGTSFHDLTVILHSVTAQWGDIPRWIYDEAGRRGDKKLVLFIGNEFKLFEEKIKLAKDLGVDFIATQLRKEDAERIYGLPVIEVPHALNPKQFFPRIGCAKRPFDIGVRGAQYKPEVGDNDRNTVVSPKLWKGLKSDCLHGKSELLKRGEWAKKLSTWRTMPSTESGLIDAKCISSRHFDAIGSLTCLVMYPGKFNGVLNESHYIRLEKDHSNLGEVKDKIRDVAYCEGLVSKAREYLLDCHTHEHRARQVMEVFNRSR